MKNTFKGFFWIMVVGSLYLSSCKSDIETINALDKEVILPDVTGFNVEMSYSDSGILKGKIYAAEVYQYMNRQDPYYEFPKGIKAVFFDKNGNQTAYITSKYAIYYPQKALWEGRNQVLAESPDEGKKVETEQIFWDQGEKRIYTDKYAKVTNPDGIFIGENGFEAKEDLSRLRMNRYSGTVTVTDTYPTDE